MKDHSKPRLFMMLTAVAFVVGAGANYWQYGGMTAKADEVSRLEKLVQDEEGLKRRLEETTAKLAETSTTLGHLEKGVPSFAYVPTLLFELESIGKTNGIDVLGVRPVVKVAPITPQKDGENLSSRRKPYEEMSIEVKGRGTYRSVMSFLKSLQKFPKIVEARTVTLSPKQLQADPDGKRSLDVSIELRAYLFKQGEEKTGKATARNLKGDKQNEG